MNCTNCNAPLAPDARFCRNCGAQISISEPTKSTTPTSASSQPNLPLTAYNAPTSFAIPAPEPQLPPLQQTLAQSQQAPQPLQQQWILPQPQSPQAHQPYFQPTVSIRTWHYAGSKLFNQRPQTFASGQNKSASPVRRRGRGLIITLITLAVLIIVLAGVWFLALRPYLHSVAQSQLDSTLTSAVNQINFPQLSQVPAGVPLPPLKVTEDQINNSYLPSLRDPSSPVQNMHIQITPTECASTLPSMDSQATSQGNLH